MRPLGPGFRPYEWAPSTEELAARTGLDPLEIVRATKRLVDALPALFRRETGEEQLAHPIELGRALDLVVVVAHVPQCQPTAPLTPQQ